MDRPILFLDLETIGHDRAEDWLDPVEPAGNLKDPEKIKASVIEKTASRRAKLGLDPHTARIVVIGTQPENGVDPVISQLTTEDDEFCDLHVLALALRDHPIICGYYIRQFDLPMLMRRAQLLDVDFPRIDLRRYSNPDVIDLYDVITFDGTLQNGAMKLTLDAVCRRFGIVVEDAHTGADVEALVAAGDYAAVAAHCRADLDRTRQLAARLRVAAGRR